MIELEAGLADGPRTATTPLDMIWHTGEKNRGVQRYKQGQLEVTEIIKVK